MLSRQARAPLIVMVLILLCGCDSGPSGTGPSSANGPKPPTTSGNAKPQPSPSSDLPKPRIDVIVEAIEVPQSVKVNREFTMTITLKNNDVGEIVARTTNVEIRASLSALNLPLGSAGAEFRQLEPGKPRKRPVVLKAPHLPGAWALLVTVDPVDYIDEHNNQRSAVLVVVP